MSTLALLYAIAMGQLVLFAATSYAIGRAIGIGVAEIRIGSPAVITLRTTPKIAIGPIPSASVDFQGAGDRTEARAWGQRPLAARLAFVLAPWVAAFGVALACLGGEAPGMVARGFRQILLTVDVTPLVRGLVDIARHAPLATTIGIVFAKLVAMNLLPFGGIAGGLALQELATPRGRNVARWVQTYLAATMLAFMLWTLARFGWAFVAVLRG